MAGATKKGHVTIALMNEHQTEERVFRSLSKSIFPNFQGPSFTGAVPNCFFETTVSAACLV